MAPIGVFDSGVGGLTVLRALRAVLPAEDFIYLGDTARLPYGTKSSDTVARYAVQCADALIARGIRCLVVACNTASASALELLRLRFPTIPVVGVIEPGARAAVAASESQYIAVIGTEGTISGGAYQAAIQRLNTAARVVALPCSLFVAMAEEGWVDGPIAEAVARRYLDGIFSPTDEHCDVPDTLVLGCTHFPAMLPVLRGILPSHVRIIDSAKTTAAAVSQALLVTELPAVGRGAGQRGAGQRGAGQRGAGRVTWLATDSAVRFARASSTFLGRPLLADEIEILDL